jgi:hypothetical protein
VRLKEGESHGFFNIRTATSKRFVREEGAAGTEQARNIRLASEASTAIPRPVKKSKSHREDVIATDQS